MAPLSEQIATLEAKAAVVDEIRLLLGGTADGVSAAQIAHLERELATAKAIVEARDNEIENLANARRADGKENDALRAKLIETLRERDEMEARLGHVLGAARADLRSAAARLGERFEGDHETDDLPTLASTFDTAIAGLLEDYECAKDVDRPAKATMPKQAKHLLAERNDDAGVPAAGPDVAGRSDPGVVAADATAVLPSPTGPRKGPLSVDDPFVIMMTTPKGRRLYREHDSAWSSPVEDGHAYGYTTYADSIDANKVRDARALRRTKVVSLSVALAPPSTKANPPRVEVLVDLGAEGAFVVGTHDTDGKRAWLTTSQGLMPEHDGQRVRTFAEVQADADEQGTPIAEFEHLDEAKAAAKDLAKSMPNAGGVCVVEVHDVGALVVAEERQEAAE